MRLPNSMPQGIHVKHIHIYTHYYVKLRRIYPPVRCKITIDFIVNYVLVYRIEVCKGIHFSKTKIDKKK